MADHHADNIVDCYLFRMQIFATNQLSVPQYSDAITNLHNLFHAMGNITNRESLFSQFFYDLKQFFNFQICQDSRGLVQNNHFRVHSQRFGDLDHLPLRHA